MQFITDYRLENYILNTNWENFPDSIKERAILCSIDLFGALIIGSAGKQYQIGKKISESLGLKGCIAVFGNQKFNLLGATIAFSHAANSFDIDDGYNMIKGHPGASFIGGILAASIEKNVSYEEFLSTLVLCYECTIRWGLVEQEYYGFLHSTGTYGAFGTAAGIGRLHRLSREKLNNALSMADYHAPMTPVMRAVEYPSMNKDGVPFGSLIGTMAVIETELGESAKTHLLELPQYMGYLDSLGKHYYIEDLYFKPYTCCRWAHQPIKACIDLMRKYTITAEKIKKVVVHTFVAATKLSKAIPNNTDEAQYNIAYPVAAAIVHGDVGYEQINDEAIHDQCVIDMMGKLTFLVDQEMEKQFPESRLAWVEIILNNDKVYKSNIYEAPGEATDPKLSYTWIVEKFKQRTSSILKREYQEKIIQILSKNNSWKLRDIMDTINEGFKPLDIK